MFACAYRVDNITPKKAVVSEVMGMVLYNGTAGVLDMQLNQKQKLIGGYAYSYMLEDLGMVVLGGYPKEGQSLNEVDELLHLEVDKIKKGQFDESLLDAVKTELEVGLQKASESNKSINNLLIEAFKRRESWLDFEKRIGLFRETTKEEVVEMANALFKDNYVKVFKGHGDADGREKIQKPEITPLDIERDHKSAFFDEVQSLKSTSIEPDFINFDNEFGGKNLENGFFIKNVKNNLFRYTVQFDTGKNDLKTLPLAVNFLKYLGTKDKSIDTISSDLYRLGSTYNFVVEPEFSQLKLFGLDRNREETVSLVSDIVENAVADEHVFKQLVNDHKKKRSDLKKDKRKILFSGMLNYAKYDGLNPFNDVLSDAELDGLDAKTVLEEFKQFALTGNEVFSYASENRYEGIKKFLGTKKESIPQNEYLHRDIIQKKVYFMNYDMTKVELLQLSKLDVDDKQNAAKISLFNEYFGGGMSSLVFQELREARALAYSVFSRLAIPTHKNDPSYLISYIGTQFDKLQIAHEAMNDLINEFKVSDSHFNNAKEAVLNGIATERIINHNIYNYYKKLQRRGIAHDIRKDIYDQTPSIDLDTLSKFHKDYVCCNPYVLMVLGHRNKIDFDYLNTIGEVEELEMEDLFGF